MQPDTEKADLSMFAHAIYLAVGALLLIIIGAIIVVSWRAHKKNTPPYTKHPVSLLINSAAPASIRLKARMDAYQRGFAGPV